MFLSEASVCHENRYVKDTRGCHCEIGPANNITLIRLSELRSEACRDPSACSSSVSGSWDGVRLLLRHHQPTSHWGGCEMWIRHRSMKGYFGQLKTSQPSPLIRVLPYSLLLGLLSVAIRHLVLSWRKAIGLQNKERRGDCRGLCVVEGMRRWMLAEKGGWLVLSKGICLRNNRSGSHLKLKRQCSHPKAHNFNATKNKSLEDYN